MPVAPSPKLKRQKMVWHPVIKSRKSAMLSPQKKTAIDQAKRIKALEDTLDDQRQAMATTMSRLSSAVDGRFFELTVELNTFVQKLDQTRFNTKMF